MSSPALLALEDGTLWPGVGFGATGHCSGEIVFNTSLTGYQEILTDPSYHGQIITMTMPHIGNYGVTPEDAESERIWATGLVVRSISPLVSNWRARQSLPDYLSDCGVIAITELPTRALVRHIREHGAMRAALSSRDPDPDRLLEMARAARDMNGLNLASEVSCSERYLYQVASDTTHHVVAYDFGIKRNILRMLAARGCRITVVPWDTPASGALELNPDGIFLSNGPGDPAAVTDAIEAVRELLGKKPIFGICLGHQILALALGARTYKLKFGHRGGNQPVQVATTSAVQISTHNHGFAVDADSLPQGIDQTHVNLNDNCCEGLAAQEHRAFSVQYHPESAPGPHDSGVLFDEFVSLMDASS